MAVEIEVIAEGEGPGIGFLEFVPAFRNCYLTKYIETYSRS